MNFYNLPQSEQNRLTAAGVDYDLRACLEYNPQSFEVEHIEKVLATWEGENDGDDWRWVIKLTAKGAKQKAGKYVFLQGGCDYTGWDCRSSADCAYFSSALSAAKFANPGFSEYRSNGEQVSANLREQLKKGKNETWMEKTEKEFNLQHLKKIG